jgi:hypothetical protein
MYQEIGRLLQRAASTPLMHQACDARSGLSAGAPGLNQFADRALCRSRFPRRSLDRGKD